MSNKVCALLSLLCCIGKYERGIILMRHAWTADGVAAVEALRAELAQAKEQARASNAAALKAAEELRAEQAAHRRSEDKIAEMVVELKNAADRYELLEKDNKASSADLNKALNATKEMLTEVRGVRGASTGRYNRDWGLLLAADEVFGSEVYSPGWTLESCRRVCGLGEAYN